MKPVFNKINKIKTADLCRSYLVKLKKKMKFLIGSVKKHFEQWANKNWDKKNFYHYEHSGLIEKKKKKSIKNILDI